MRSDRLDNENLENIGKALFTAGALREAEIDRIAAREDLFSGVLTKVNSNAIAKKEVFSLARFVRRHELGIGGAFAVVLLAGILGLYLSQVPSGKPSMQAKIASQSPVAARSEVTSRAIVNESAPNRMQDRMLDAANEPAQPVAERTVYRQPRSAGQPRPQRASVENAVEPEFYPVTYTGDNGESARGGRVIRVDVPRSTLFAMGMNVPLENESPTVKADLLVGPDGVTRAIRLVE